jgi:hypothetical protein
VLSWHRASHFISGWRHDNVKHDNSCVTATQ